MFGSGGGGGARRRHRVALRVAPALRRAVLLDEVAAELNAVAEQA